MELTEAGAHMDTVNMQGETPFQAATTGELWRARGVCNAMGLIRLFGAQCTLLTCLLSRCCRNYFTDPDEAQLEMYGCQGREKLQPDVPGAGTPVARELHWTPRSWGEAGMT